MEAKKIPEVIPNSGQKMPLRGLGTTAIPLPPHENLISIFIDGFEVGYIHFDTASIYGTKEPLGQAVAKALELGLITSRDEGFITSKLWCANAHHDLVLPALKTTLHKMGLEYVDLYLIHWPVRLKPEAEGVLNTSKEDVIPFDIKGTWEAMEECHRLGLAKSIGVSNFGIKKLLQLLKNTTIPPAVNQVEMNPSWQQGKRVLQAERSPCECMVTTRSLQNFLGSNAVMENPILQEIASARQKRVAQIALKWIYEQGASAIVKSFNKERMKVNLEIFDWELLNQEESHKFSQIPQRRMFPGDFFISEDGPYKSLEELWDGDP